MSDIITPATAIATLTFLWYRKGRLWNFYDSLLSKAIKQIEERSLDRKAWEQIALEQCSMLSNELFNSLFRFEIEYLRDKIINGIEPQGKPWTRFKGISPPQAVGY